MKKLESIKVDDHLVEIEAHRKDGGILFVATWGSIKRESFMSMHTDSPSTPEQHAINAHIVELRYHDLRFSLH